MAETYCFNSSCLTPTIGAAPQSFLSALQYFAMAQCFIDIPYIREDNICDCAKFDFIIIGAGPAGCALANRLSEISTWNILLIEAGGDPPIETYIPSFSKSFYDTLYDWSYRSVVNSTTQAVENGSTYLPAGKMFGGSTSLNGMYYIRGLIEDYQQWYDQGNKDWHPDVIKVYFDKLESLQNGKLLKNASINANYGQNGPVLINTFNNTNKYFNKILLASWRELGIQNALDINTPGARSAVTTVTASNGRRNTAATNYLTPDVINRPNLKILKYALATKILIDPETKTAYGVEVDHEGCNKTFYAKLEVICSAGTIGSPQLLLLSGVGPRTQLEAENIQCIYDSPSVGLNMEDHITVNIPIFGNYSFKKNTGEDKLESIIYLYNRTGSLAQSGFSDVLTFIPLSKNSKVPDVEVLVTVQQKNSSTVRDSLYAQYKYKREILNSFVNPNKKYALFIFTIIFLHPKSKGSVFLKSNDPRDKPLFDSNFFSVPEDLKRIVQGVKKVAEIVNTTCFKSFDAFLGRIYWPDCDEYDMNSDEYWECVCLNTGLTDYHNVGTCRMGPDPNTSVVASDLKVHGINKLRVVNAAVIPYQLSGNPMATVYMIGERASDLIKEYYEMI